VKHPNRARAILFRALGGLTSSLLSLAMPLLFLPGPAFAGPETAEVRALHVRGTRVLPDGSVTLFAAFRSGEDAPVAGLEPEKLLIDLDGSSVAGKAPLVPFLESGEGTAVLLAVDISGSMQPAMKQVRQALSGYANQMRPGLDRTAVGTIGDSWQLTLDFTGDADLVSRALERLPSGSTTTALFESIHLGVDLLRKRGSELPARRFMLVVSDGLNEKQGRTASECIEAAKAASIQVHSIILQVKRNERTLSALGQLEKVSRDSGGMTWTTDDPSQLQGAMDRLKADLAGEVVVTLPASSLKNDGREHELTLRYDRVSARLQYQAPLIASKEPVPAPSASHLPLALGGAGLVLLVGVATPLFVRSRRKATQAVMAREDALRQEIDARDRAMEQLRQAQGAMRDTQAAPASDASVRRSDPARDPGLDPGRDPKRSAAETGPQRAPLPLSSAASSTQRRTEYRPADSAPLTVTRLRIVRGMEGVSVLTIPLQGGKLGYELSNDIVLNADSISSRHAEIIAIAGGYAIRDLGSSNGTFIDEVRVGSEPMPLRLGAQLKLGLVTTVCE